MEESSFTVIENSTEGRREYGTAYGAETFIITEEDIEALRNGKALAVDINGGEYVAFIAMEE